MYLSGKILNYLKPALYDLIPVTTSNDLGNRQQS